MKRKRQILLAEDENRLRTGLEFILSSAGYNVIAVENGEQAYQVLKKDEKSKNFDILLTDIVMPKINGLELLQKLNRENLLPPVVLGLSAYADDTTMSQMKDAGCQDLLDKPFQVTELLTLLAASEVRNTLNCN